MSHVLADGIKPVFRVRTRSGREARITATHPLLTARDRDVLADDKLRKRIWRPVGSPGQPRARTEGWT